MTRDRATGEPLTANDREQPLPRDVGQAIVPLNDSPDVTPFVLLDQWLSDATGDLVEVAGKCGAITDPAELWQLIDRLRSDVKLALSQAEDELVRLAHVAIKDAGGEITVGDQTIEAGWQAGGTEWDSPLLVPAVAARAADEFSVDRETGEVPPPAVFAENVARRMAECLGGLTKSASWRTGPLEAMGLDVDNYRQKKPGKIRVGVKQPKPALKPQEKAA